MNLANPGVTYLTLMRWWRGSGDTSYLPATGNDEAVLPVVTIVRAGRCWSLHGLGTVAPTGATGRDADTLSRCS